MKKTFAFIFWIFACLFWVYCTLLGILHCTKLVSILKWALPTGTLSNASSLKLIEAAHKNYN